MSTTCILLLDCFFISVTQVMNIVSMAFLCVNILISVY